MVQISTNYKKFTINSLWFPLLLLEKYHFALRKGDNSYKLEAQWAELVSLTFHSALRKLNTEPSFGSFGSAITEKKIFRNRPIRNKNGLWWPCLLTDGN